MIRNASDQPDNTARSSDPAPAPDEVGERLRRLETRVETLAEAVRALAHGLETVPALAASAETTTEQQEEAARGARLAHELLLARGL